MLSNDSNLLLWFQNWIDRTRCHCYHCDKDKLETSFYKVPKSYVYTNGRLPICKKCMNKMFHYYYGRYGSRYKAMSKLCQLFDIYYDTRLFKSIEDDSCVVGRYMQKLNLRQNKYKLSRGYDGSYLKIKN